jgi:hypothetical protein
MQVYTALFYLMGVIPAIFASLIVPAGRSKNKVLMLMLLMTMMMMMLLMTMMMMMLMMMTMTVKLIPGTMCAAAAAALMNSH